MSRKANVRVTYFTDPLCCWSWGFEPIWRRFRQELAGKIAWSYCLGGLVEDWNNYYDPINQVFRPIHMGPLWLQAEKITRMPMNHKIWITDPPNSSLPPSLAFKCLEKQSPAAADLFLKMVREKLMLENQNISRPSTIYPLAYKVSKKLPGQIDLDLFHTDFYLGIGENLLKKDKLKFKQYKVIHFPTIHIESEGHSLKIEGYHTYNQFMQKVKEAFPTLKPRKRSYKSIGYEDYWRQVSKQNLSARVM